MNKLIGLGKVSRETKSNDAKCVSPNVQKDNLADEADNCAGTQICRHPQSANQAGNAC